MIVGVTHSKEGQTLIRRSVTVKVAIGRGPDGKRNYPEKLDHFIFLRKEQGGDSVEWVEDEQMTAHFRKLSGDEDPTEVAIILLDDSIDNVFRTEYAWWAATGKKCHGDGERALREKDGVWSDRTDCANSGKCQEYESGDCKPSADLYFMLADFPTLGTACRLHTSSYQSIREIYSALTDLKNMMGGRLLGLPVKLFVRPEKNVYEQAGKKKTGTKYVLGLEIRAESLGKMLESVTESAKVFADLRKVMQGNRIEIVEDDTERAPEIAGEFHVPLEKVLPAAQLPPPVAINPLQAEFEALCTKLNLNNANRHFLLTRYNGDYEKALLELRVMDAGDLDAPKGARESFPKKKPPKKADAPTEPPATGPQKAYGF